MNTFKKSLVTLLCAAFLMVPLQAGSDAKATEWLEKMVKAYANTPHSIDYEGSMAAAQMGQEFTMKMSGTMTTKDQTHQHSTMKMAMQMPQGPMEMNGIVVMDGTMIWTEMKLPANMGGMLQVTKMSLELLNKVSEELGGAGMGMSSQMDPAKMIENMKKTMDITFKGIADGKVTLEAAMTKESAQKMGMSNLNVPIEDMKFTMTLDEKNIFPSSMAIDIKATDGAKIPFKLDYKNFKKLDSVDDKMFTYTAPEGAMVIDGDQMLKQQLNMKNGGQEQGGHGHSHGEGDGHGHKHD